MALAVEPPAPIDEREQLPVLRAEIGEPLPGLQELGERSRARAALNSAVYLRPDFTLAHFALGNHARAEARVAEARRHFDNAARLLSGLAAGDEVPESEGLTAGRLREIILSLSRDS